jgi:hypothetical protein
MIIRINENISDFFKLTIVYPYIRKESRMKKDFESLNEMSRKNNRVISQKRR